MLNCVTRSLIIHFIPNLIKTHTLTKLRRIKKQKQKQHRQMNGCAQTHYCIVYKHVYVCAHVLVIEFICLI